MKRILLVSVLLSLLTLHFTSCSKDSPSEPKQEQTLSEKLQEALDNALEASNGIGVSVAVIMPDGDVTLCVSGISHPGTPISTDMLFDMGSAGKNLFAALILKLAEERILSLDDSLFHYLPPFPHVDSTITIRQGLNHTSGLTYFIEHPQSPYQNPFNSNDFEKWWSMEEIFNTLMEEPYFAPGEGWHYSQGGYQLGTLIVEQLTQSTVATEIQERLMGPLDIHGMLLDLSKPIPSNYNIAHQWFDTDDDGEFEDISDRSLNWIISLSRILYYTRAEDFARWIHALYHEKRVLSQSSLDEMLTFISPCPGEPLVAGYGLGVYEMSSEFTQGIRMYGHSGSQWGYTAMGFYLPDYGVSISMLVNVGAQGLADNVINSVWPSFLEVILKHVS
jgi:D-alanyl-D-alanine carboxypeptidase